MGNVITKNNRLEWGIFALFIALLLFSMQVHEPWYDEAQAWLIARDASLKDILWLLPHYEGHPPFFHLLLAIPAKLGIGWQWGLRGIGALFSIASAYLIIFKAPFPRWIRLTIPFTYFLFYQYSVIVRPYNIMVFIMCLLAICFPQKDKRPGLFVGLLAALCACHLFGIAIAGGITLAWLWEIKNGRPFKEYIPALWKDKRFHWMLGLLGWTLLLFVLISPQQDAFAVDIVRRTPLWERIFYMWVLLPADLTITNITGTGFLPDIFIDFSGILFSVLGGGIIWVLIYYFLPHKYAKYLLLPYFFLVSLFMYYAYCHHIGLAALVILWVFWIAYAAQETPIHKPIWVTKMAPGLLSCFLLCCVGWSLFDVYADYKLPVFNGQDLINFLHRHNLEDKRIFAPWDIVPPKSVDQFSPYDEEKQNTEHLAMAVLVNMYAQRNMIANLNGGGPIPYLSHAVPSPQRNQQNLQLWQEGGIPDLIIDTVQLERIFPQQPDLQQQYVPVYYLFSSKIWKFNKPHLHPIVLWAHKDLVDKHHLRFVKRPSSLDPNY